MKLFFGLTLISFVFSFTVENDCSLKGPSYWCQSKSTAIKCQATNYCENHVWLKGKSAKDVDLCATCKQEVNMLHAFIEKNETYVMIISFLKQECDMFPSSVRDACNGIVGVYATKIIDYIVMTTSDAQASCTQFGLCTAFMSFVDAKKDLMLDGTDYCLTCQQYVGTLHLIISNKGTKDEIISELKNSCSLVQNESYKQICTVLVDTFASKAFDWLIDYTGRPISFCTLLQLCKASFIPLVRGVPMINEFGLSMKNSDLVIDMIANVMLKAQKEVKQTQPKSVSHKNVSPKSVSCELCTMAMSSLEDILKGNETKAEVKQALEQVCGFLPASLKSECDQLVDTYSNQIVDLIVAELSDPNSICKQIGLCASKIKKVMTKTVKQDVKQGVTCELCTMVISYLENILKGNETKAEIKQTLEQVCGFLPASVKSECDQLVVSYSDEIIDLIIELADPNSICKLIGLCTSQVNKVEQIQPKGVSCELCTMAMSSLEDILKGNETKAEVKQALEQACGFLPASLKSECDQLVDTYSDEIVDLIVAELSDPNAICKQIGLCASKIKKVMTKTVKQGVKQGVTCELCTMVISYLENILKGNETKAEIKQTLEQVCGFLPASVKSECDQLVVSYSDKIIDLIIELADPNSICKLIGLCTSQVNKVKQTQPKSDSCELCTMAMSSLEDILKGNETKAEVKQALEQVCGFLPASLKSECDQLVDAYSDQIVDLVVAELSDPNAICKQIGLCTSKINKVMTKTEKQSVKQLSQVNKVKQAQPKGDSCELCTMAMSSLEDILKGNETKAEVKQALEQVCGFLPASLKSECDQLVDAYSDQIVDLIVIELSDPNAICKQIGLCTSKINKVIKQKTVNSVTCELCTMAMSSLENILKGNESKAEIKQALEQVCGSLPTSVKSECDQLVDTYSDDIVDLIIQLTDPNTICKQIGLCASKIKKVIKQKTVDSVTCELCTMAMSSLESILKGNESKAEIKQALEQVCGLLPSSVKSECDQFVDTYSDKIVDLIIQLADPNTICKLLGLCASKIKNVNHDSSNGVTCDFCQYAMGKLDAILTDNATEAEIKQAVENLCAKFPSAVAGECKILIDRYGDMIISMLAQELKPSVICQALGLCTEKITAKFTKLKKKHFLSMRQEVKGVSCSVCEYAMGYLDKELETKNVETKIEQEIQVLCKKLPSAFSNECDALITEYGDDLIKLVVEQMEPAEVCKILKLC
ncbi:uncharacterized protein LOC100208544 isoform X6 [Hydra vulgaris]|uniref:Uncharacterized protein LOC100208544 isoform X6 n=1 Tax=Hydra vulgaris TaxID=6087 RepID=A0ABM4D3I9_HYDVU